MSEQNERRHVSAAMVRAACISASTQRSYASNVRVISQWIKSNHEDWRQFFDETGAIDVTVFTPQHFEQFLVDRTNARAVKVTTLSGYRSAMKNMYRSKQIPIPHEYGEDLKTLFSGMKRIEASEHQSGGIKHTGKAPLNFSTFQDLSKKMLALMDGGFSHLFLITQWNLMCRSKSVETLDTAHISCEDDSIGCVFHKTKTNQDGSGPKDPRHIYANPYNPSICWVTALGIYLACNPDQAPGPLFPGSNQKNRFGKVIARLLSSNGADESKRFGTHSIRKGAATFACSGSTGGPAIVSVCL